MGGNSSKASAVPAVAPPLIYATATGQYDPAKSKWSVSQVQRLILNGNLAPRVAGLENEIDSQTTDCLVCFETYMQDCLNSLACCKKMICSECFLSIQDPAFSNECPYCKRERFRVTYAGPSVLVQRGDKKHPHYRNPLSTAPVASASGSGNKPSSFASGRASIASPTSSATPTSAATSPTTPTTSSGAGAAAGVGSGSTGTNGMVAVTGGGGRPRLMSKKDLEAVGIVFATVQDREDTRREILSQNTPSDVPYLTALPASTTAASGGGNGGGGSSGIGAAADRNTTRTATGGTSIATASVTPSGSGNGPRSSTGGSYRSTFNPSSASFRSTTSMSASHHEDFDGSCGSAVDGRVAGGAHPAPNGSYVPSASAAIAAMTAMRAELAAMGYYGSGGDGGNGFHAPDEDDDGLQLDILMQLLHAEALGLMPSNRGVDAATTPGSASVSVSAAAGMQASTDASASTSRALTGSSSTSGVATTGSDVSGGNNPFGAASSSRSGPSTAAVTAAAAVTTGSAIPSVDTTRNGVSSSPSTTLPSETSIASNAFPAHVDDSMSNWRARLMRGAVSAATTSQRELGAAVSQSTASFRAQSPQSPHTESLSTTPASLARTGSPADQTFQQGRRCSGGLFSRWASDRDRRSTPTAQSVRSTSITDYSNSGGIRSSPYDTTATATHIYDSESTHASGSRVREVFMTPLSTATTGTTAATTVGRTMTVNNAALGLVGREDDLDDFLDDDDDDDDDDNDEDEDEGEQLDDDGRNDEDDEGYDNEGGTGGSTSMSMFGALGYGQRERRGRDRGTGTGTHADNAMRSSTAASHHQESLSRSPPHRSVGDRNGSSTAGSRSDTSMAASPSLISLITQATHTPLSSATVAAIHHPTGASSASTSTTRQPMHRMSGGGATTDMNTITSTESEDEEERQLREAILLSFQSSGLGSPSTSSASLTRSSTVLAAAGTSSSDPLQPLASASTSTVNAVSADVMRATGSGNDSRTVTGDPVTVPMPAFNTTVSSDSTR